MTKTEYRKCEKLMERAISKGKQAFKEYDQSEYYGVNCFDGEMREIEQRKADQHYGEAVGISQALSALGFKHDRMKELSELL